MSCDLGTLIHDHFNMLIDIFGKDLKDLGVESVYTKCLYTSVTILYILCGNKAIEGSLKCYVNNVKERMEGLSDSDVESHIKRDARDASMRILANNRRRMVYFMMITNAELPHAKNKERKDAFFPGHVFVIDKLFYANEKFPRYKLYQSYINKYTLQDFSERKKKRKRNTNNNDNDDKAMDYTYEEMTVFLEKLSHLLNSKTWTSDNVKFWKEFTHVSAEYMKGYSLQPYIYFCYNELPAIRCRLGLLNLLKDKLLKNEIPDRYVAVVEKLVKTTRTNSQIESQIGSQKIGSQKSSKKNDSNVFTNNSATDRRVDFISKEKRINE